MWHDTAQKPLLSAPPQSPIPIHSGRWLTAPRCSMLIQSCSTLRSGRGISGLQNAAVLSKLLMKIKD
ncbi:hypothetical protein E2C01_005934 [Portunus trituberculatus]|uniref:Uncharacterized protein n=1 Tax=Portunus trituberculatus TaxID=210409 RepID=A0A5B7CWI6_PORTR|nr:hypothetical protein [Portunus trituberculatus]